VSDHSVARAARERLGDFAPDKFEREFLSPQQLTLEDFERFIRHETAIQQLVGVAAASAKMLSPREAESLYRKEHEQVAVDVVGFWGTNYLAKVQASPAAISNYYTQNAAKYRIPPRVQVSYLEFSASNYLAEADKELAQRTNINAYVEEEYTKRGGTNSFKDTNGVPMAAQAAKDKLKEDIRIQFALMSARRKAAEFGNKLLDQKQQTLQTFENLAAAEGYPVKVSPPFHKQEDIDFPTAFRDKAVALNRESPILYSPIPGEHAVYVLALKTNLPSELPPLDKIREKVAADYKHAQALEMARKEGTAFQTTLTNGLAQKKTFAEISASANVKPVSVPPFSSITNAVPGLDERIDLRTLQNDGFKLKPGEASQFQNNPEGGFVSYLKERIPVSDAQAKAELPDFIGHLRAYRQNEAFNDWFRKEAEQARLTLPKSQTEVSGAQR
jgi:peptidyl-prolyl cis-trans isomerase D